MMTLINRSDLRSHFKHGVYTKKQCIQRARNFRKIMGGCLSVFIMVDTAILFALIVGDQQVWLTLLGTGILLVWIIIYVTRQMSKWMLIPKNGTDALLEFSQPYADVTYYLQEIMSVRNTLTKYEFDIFTRALEQRIRAKYANSGNNTVDHSVDMLA